MTWNDHLKFKKIRWVDHLNCVAWRSRHHHCCVALLSFCFFSLLTKDTFYQTSFFLIHEMQIKHDLETFLSVRSSACMRSSHHAHDLLKLDSPCFSSFFSYIHSASITGAIYRLQSHLLLERICPHLFWWKGCSSSHSSWLLHSLKRWVHHRTLLLLLITSPYPSYTRPISAMLHRYTMMIAQHLLIYIYSKAAYTWSLLSSFSFCKHISAHNHVPSLHAAPSSSNQ